MSVLFCKCLFYRKKIRGISNLINVDMLDFIAISVSVYVSVFCQD